MEIDGAVAEYTDMKAHVNDMLDLAAELKRVLREEKKELAVTLSHRRENALARKRPAERAHDAAHVESMDEMSRLVQELKDQLKRTKKKRHQWRAGSRPVLTHEVTGERMYPSDCTCNFSGSCLAYCSPYK
jgi:hypothetical protein